MLTDLHILYTHGLAESWAQLPRVYTALQSIEQEQGLKALRLNLGTACSPTLWHCEATQGRSMPMAFDVMGYHAVDVTGMPEASRFKLKGVVTLGLVDAQHTWRYEAAGIADDTILVASTPTPAVRLCIVLQPADETHLTEGVLLLKPVPADQVGYIHIDFTTQPQLVQSTSFSLNMRARPDPTITAALELIEEEARSFRPRSS
jgi:hypothetical protein